MSWSETELKVIRWAEARGIIQNSTAQAQWIKADEEMGELWAALEANDRTEIIDAIGDTMVCLINLAAILDLDVTKCLEAAYEQIKDRRGHMNSEGIFVKEAT